MKAAPASPLRASRMIPRCLHSASRVRAAALAPMEGINWPICHCDRSLSGGDRRAQRAARLRRAVLDFFSETGLVFMAFCRATHCVRRRCSCSLPAVEFKALNVHLLVVIIAAAAVLVTRSITYIGAWLGKKVMTAQSDGLINKRLMKTHAFFERHERKTVMISACSGGALVCAARAGASGWTSQVSVFQRIGGVWVVSLVYGGSLFSTYARSRQPWRYLGRRHRCRRRAAAVDGVYKTTSSPKSGALK